MRGSAAPWVTGLTGLLLWASISMPVEGRQVRKGVSAADLQGLFLEIPTGSIVVEPSPRRDIRMILGLECVGELIACGKVERSVDFAVTVEGSQARVSLAGVTGHESRLRGGEIRGPGGSRQIDGSFDQNSRRWSTSKEWDWKRPKPGDWTLKVHLTVLVPTTLALNIRADTGDVRVRRAMQPTRIELAKGFAFAGVARAETSTVRLEVKRGKHRVVDQQGRELEVTKGRNYAEWRGDGDKVSVLLKVGRGSAQIRVL